MILILQAAWILDDSDVSGSDSDDGSDHGMVVDEGEHDFTGQDNGGRFDLEDDQASLKLRDSDDETEADSVMMVSYILLPFHVLITFMVIICECHSITLFNLHSNGVVYQCMQTPLKILFRKIASCCDTFTQSGLLFINSTKWLPLL